MNWSPRYWTHRLLTLKATPRSIALGASIGMFVALTPTIGVQTVVAALIAWICGASKPAAIIPVWISNPFTMLPMFGFTYWVGTWFWPGQTLTNFPDTLQAILENPQITFIEQSRQMLELGGALLGPLWIGGILVGGLLGLGTYPLVHWAVIATKRHRLHKRRLKRQAEVDAPA